MRLLHHLLLLRPGLQVTHDVVVAGVDPLLLLFVLVDELGIEDLLHLAFFVLEVFDLLLDGLVDLFQMCRQLHFELLFLLFQGLDLGLLVGPVGILAGGQEHTRQQNKSRGEYGADHLGNLPCE